MVLLGIEKVLQEHQNGGGQNFYEKYSVLKARLLEHEYTQTSAEFEGGNDHGPQHIRRVLNKLEDILGEEPLKHLNVFELWLAMMAVLYHDVGLLQARENHPQIGADLLLGDRNTIIMDRVQRDVIRTAICSHGSKVDINEACRRYPKPHRIGDFPVDVRYVCALVRLADELDEDYRRGDEDLFHKRRIAERYPQSVPFWYFNQRITGIHIIPPNANRREVQFHTEFLPSDLEYHVDAAGGARDPFVLFALKKFLKIARECALCGKFFPDALKLSHVVIKLLPNELSSWDTSRDIDIDERTEIEDVVSRLPLELRIAADTRESPREASRSSASVFAFTAPSSLQKGVVEPPPLSVDVSVSRNSPGPPDEADSGLESSLVADHGAQLEKKNSEVEAKGDLEAVPSTPRAEVVPLIYATTLTAASQYRSVRSSERSALCDSLKQHKIAWLVAEWGMGKYEFLHACLAGSEAQHAPVPVIRMDCVELAERGFLAKPESCIDILVREARLLALDLEGAAILLDDVPYDRSSPVGGASIHDRVEILAQRLVERFGGSRVVLMSRCTPARACLPVVCLDALGEEECQRYVEAHAGGGKDIVRVEHIERLYEMSEGVPMYLDWLLKQLRVVSIGELVDSIDRDAFAALVDIEPIPRALGHAVDGLLSSADRYTRRSVHLLKMLTVLSRGETLRVAQDIDFHAVKHIDRKEPFFPENVTQLCALGLLRAKPIMDVETSFQDPRRSATADSQKNLIVPKPIRDYVSNRLLTEEERRDIAQTALDRLLGNGWRCGEPALGWIARIPVRSALGVQVGPGNPFVVLMWLLGDAVKRGADASSKNLLVVIEAFIGALRDVDRFRDVHLICGEVVRFLDSVNRAGDAARISLDYGRGLRMLGHHQEAIWALERAARYNPEGVSNQWKSNVRVGLALAYASVENHLAAKDYAREAVQLAGVDSAVGYQARSILIKLDDSLSDVDRQEKLKYLWQRARKRKYWTVANNLALDLANEADDARAKADFRRSVMSTNDAYNVLRAKLSDAEELIRARRVNEISMEDRQYFQSAYSYLYHQRMGNLFERCLNVLWEVEHHRTSFLQILFRISTPLLRLLGKDKKEERYRAELVRLLPGGASD